MEEYGNCHKCYLGYEGGCNMYDFWLGTDKASYHRCKKYMSKEDYENWSWRKYGGCKGGTTESDLD